MAFGMDYWYAELHLQSGSDEDNARAIVSLIAAGYIGATSRSRSIA